MKMNSFGGAAQTRGNAECGVRSAESETVRILSSNSVPDPESGVKSFEKADTRSVLIGPAPGRTFPETFQLPPVIPAFWTGSLSKRDHSFVKGEITLESNQLILRIDGRRCHCGDEVALGSIEGNFRQRDRGYRSRNLTGTHPIIGPPGGAQTQKRRRPGPARRSSGRSGC